MALLPSYFEIQVAFAGDAVIVFVGADVFEMQIEDVAFERADGVAALGVGHHLGRPLGIVVVPAPGDLLAIGFALHLAPA